MTNGTFRARTEDARGRHHHSPPILLAFEQAERETDPAKSQRC